MMQFNRKEAREAYKTTNIITKQLLDNRRVTRRVHTAYPSPINAGHPLYTLHNMMTKLSLDCIVITGQCNIAFEQYTCSQ